MTYSLDFDSLPVERVVEAGRYSASAVQEELAEVLYNPRIEANRLHSLPDCYKIKLRSSGYRLVYRVIDQ